jgi:acetamidase/formamidase
VPTHHLSHEVIHTAWDNALPPLLTIAPGDTVVFETLEPSKGYVARDVAKEAPPDADPELVALVAATARPERPRTPATEMGGHALTGPVAVAGAEPGDTLVVEVLRIVPAAWGWTATGPTHGLLKEELSEWTLHLWDLRAGDTALFAPGIRVPIAPFCGVMGVAPAESGQHSTVPPRRAGGNMDVRQLTAGATLSLPVLVPGALFSVGDVHAAQGDGEVGGTAIETDATVTLRFDLLKDQSIATPQFRTPTTPGGTVGPCFAATGHDADLYQAARQALRGVVSNLEAQYGLTRPKAIILASACVDLRISQLVNGSTWTVSAFLPLSIFARE